MAGRAFYFHDGTNRMVISLPVGETVLVGSIRVKLPTQSFPDFREGQQVELGLRPARMDIAEPGSANAIGGHVVLIENLGGEGQVIASVDGVEMAFVTKNFRRLRAGDRVHFSIPPQHVHVFDPENGGSLLKQKDCA
jgi:multiple sugar transport system ATP-binding protein